MFCVYILKSLVDDGLYIGKTSDLKRRIKEHNEGFSQSTKLRKPFVLVYCEVYKSSKDASVREIKLKNFKNSYKELKKRIENSLKV